MAINKELYERYKQLKAQGINITLAELKSQMEGVNDATNQNLTPQQSVSYGVSNATNQSLTPQQSVSYGVSNATNQSLTPQQSSSFGVNDVSNQSPTPQQTNTSTSPMERNEYVNERSEFTNSKEGSSQIQQSLWTTSYSTPNTNVYQQQTLTQSSDLPYTGNLVQSTEIPQNNSYMNQFTSAFTPQVTSNSINETITNPYQGNITQPTTPIYEKGTKFGLLGYPLGHSLSTFIHNAGFKSLNLNYTYEILETSPEKLVDRIKYLKTNNYAGFNITIPLKIPIIMFLDELDSSADIIGAVNTVIINPDKTMKGYNTDVLGFKNAIPKDFPLDGKTAGVLGTGGAARAAITALASSGVKEIKIYTRNIPNSAELLNYLRLKFPTVEFNAYQIEYIRDLSTIDILVNCTPIGMQGRAADLTPIEENELKTLPDGSLVYDVIYNPKKTVLLKLAEKNGYRTVNGVDMFIWQAVEAEKIWTGRTPDYKDMKIAALENL